MTHSAVLGNLNQTVCGKQPYDYIADFLTGRQAILELSDIKSKQIKLGSRGTPQGSVLSPLPFNIAFLGLPEKLHEIPNQRHPLYPDITFWTGTDSVVGL